MGKPGIGGQQGLGLMRVESSTLLKQTKSSMQKVSEHFLVATIRPLEKKRAKTDSDPTISYLSTNKREVPPCLYGLGATTMMLAALRAASSCLCPDPSPPGRTSWSSA